MSTDVKLSKLLITRYKNKLFAISYDGNIANEIEYIENNSLLGSIHIGRVKKISKNINAAFVEIEYNIFYIRHIKIHRLTLFIVFNLHKCGIYIL